MYRDPYHHQDVPKPPSNRAERRKSRALRTSTEAPTAPTESNTTCAIILGIPVAMAFLIALLATVIPGISAVAPALWILSIVFALLISASKQMMFRAWRETRRESRH